MRCTFYIGPLINIADKTTLVRSCLMKIQRKFSKEFKLQILEEIFSGGTTTTAACRKYSITYPVVKQ
jgi:transposase-like protein